MKGRNPPPPPQKKNNNKNYTSNAINSLSNKEYTCDKPDQIDCSLFFIVFVQ